MKKVLFISLAFFVFINMLDAAVIYVDKDATGASNGSDWTNAYTTLQAALENAISGDEIWVAAGTYKPTEEPDGTIDESRKFSFAMVDGVEIYGGFAGTETAVSQRTDYSHGETNETILSGDFNNDDVISGSGSTLSITGNTENVYNVFYHGEGVTITSTALLDGFTIKGGNADGSSDYGDGGAINNSDGQNPTINHCYFIGNYASDKGGAVQNNDNSTSMTVTNCTFAQNYAGTGGGAFSIFKSDATISNCLFYGNNADSDWGGAILVRDVAGLTITNSTVTENNARSGGGIHCTDNSTVSITNCIAYGNSITTGAGPQIRIYSNSTANISYTDIQDGIGTGATTGNGSTINDIGNNIAANPIFVGSTLNPSHPYALLGTSPCVDVGGNAFTSETYDIRGNDFDRKLDKTNGAAGTIDLGAYEYKYGSDFADNNMIFVDWDAAGNDDGTNWDNAYKSFQNALGAAVSGKQIWVAKGTYFPSVVVGGTGDRNKAFQMINGVTIFGGFAGTETTSTARTDYSVGGTNETILSGDIGTIGVNTDNCYHVIHHPNGSGINNTAVIDGFSITKGYADGTSYDNDGAGMNNDNASPTLRNCIFYDNHATGGGGGMRNFRTSQTIITNCVFTNNSALNGGGILNSNTYSYTTISNSTFTLNSAGVYGGGAICNESTSYSNISNCVFSENTVVGFTGGAIEAGQLSIINCTSCTFFNNTTDKNGGAVGLFSGGGEFVNCLFYNNSATGLTSTGGAIYQYSPTNDFSLINCTFSGNSSTTSGGGVSIVGTSSGTRTIINTIVSNNYAAGSPEIFVSNGGISISHTCIKGGIGSITNATDGGNNIDFYPYFVGASGNPNHPYSIYGISPCVDAGDYKTTVENYDIRGNGFGRMLNGANGTAGTIDMGAYEYKYGSDPAGPAQLYVDADASGEYTGLNWAGAFTSLQSALDIAPSGGQIWVASGTYKPSQETDGTTDTPAEFAFQMVEGVEIYGGFAGTESAISERTDYGLGGANETILSGDVNGDDVVTGSGETLSFSNTDDNIFQVFQHPSGYTLTNAAVLDGFTIKGAHNGNLYGGGMMNQGDAEPSISSCTFTENFALNGGGVSHNASVPAISNCIFTKNRANKGGGLYIYNGGIGGIVTETDFYGNKSSDNGGAIFTRQTNETYINCEMYDNYAGYAGGAMFIYDGDLTLKNIKVTANEASRDGGGLSVLFCSPTIINATIAENIAKYGGGFYTSGTTASNNPIVTNTIIWNNDATSSGDQIYNYNENIITFTNCDFEGSGGSADWNYRRGIDGGNNIDIDPIFYNSSIGDFRIISHSPCADAGLNSANDENYDVRGNGFGRKLNAADGSSGIIDMGAYEYKFGTDPSYALTTWTGAYNSDWQHVSNWSHKGFPTEYHNVIIPDVTNDPHINPTDTITINDLTINSGATLTLESWSNGTGSLIVNGTLTNNGTFETQCFLWELGWHFVSPSTTGVTADDFYWDDEPVCWLTYHTESTNGWTYNTDLATAMPVGQGWSVWIDDNQYHGFKVASMIGSMRLTDLDVSLSYSGSGDTEGWNLIGNPFTSSLNWDQGSWGSNTSGTVYVWDNDYNGGDYRMWNGDDGDLTDGIIPINQGFFVKASAAGNFTIPADARVHNSTVFYKSTTEQNESPFVRLQMDFGDHGNTVFVGFPENGTSNFDLRGDADKLISSTDLPQIFVTENDKKLSINALEPLGGEEKTVPLFLTQVIDGEYTFTMSQMENLPDVNIKLEDLKTGFVQDMNNKPAYTFTANTSDEEGRFLLHFKSSPFGIDDPVQTANQNIRIYAVDNRIYIHSQANAVLEKGRLEVFNMTGQNVLKRQIPAGSLISIPVQISGNYVIVRVIKGNEVKTEKVFIK